VILALPEALVNPSERGVAGGGFSIRDIVVEVAGFDPCGLDVIVVTRAYDSGSEELGVHGGSRGPPGGVASYLEAEALELFAELYPGLRPSVGQRVAWRILSGMLESGGSLLVVMPTGSGKSAIFHVASRLASLNGIGSYTLVVTPLRALMRDQVYRAGMRGLRARLVDSSLSRAERAEAYRAARRGLLDLLYVSPERFWDGEFRELLRESPPSLIVLDEVHVVTSWGSTFRPAYLNAVKTIASHRAKFKPPILGLSATLTMRDAVEILRMLGHRREPVVVDLEAGEPTIQVDPETPVVVKASPIRGNLSFEIIVAPQGSERLKLLGEIVRSRVESLRSTGRPWVGVVFTGYAESKAVGWANVGTIARALGELLDVKILAYHGEMGERARREVEELILSGKLREAVVVATKAFGMGVDVPNIRWVVFYTLPESIEELYQESGRAGRDGEPAWITILYNPGDIEVKRRLAWISRLRPSYVLRVGNTLAKLGEALPRDYGYMLVPLEAFEYRVSALRALETLRGEGLLDYHVARGSRLVVASDCSGVYMKLAEARCIKPGGGEGVEVEVEVCRGNPLFDPLRLKANNVVLVETGKCVGRWMRVESTRVAVVEAVGGKLPFRQLLDPQTMYGYVRSWVEALEGLDRLEGVIEKALAARSVGAVDQVLKREIASYLEGRSNSLKEPPETPRVVECSRDCYERAVEELRRLIKPLGNPWGVTVFYEDPWDVGMLRKRYMEATGSEAGFRARALSKLFKLIARGGWERLMDEGYILILAREGRRAERLLESLEGYRYHVAIVWNQRSAG